MLQRSFKPIKCKTSLKLAIARIKLMRNKKEVQLKQMKRDLAQLLESDQERTARIRVEHVIREEKMMAAYELIEIYCELITARLPIIESQKNCPIDLKEAITSIIFASPRCGDIAELKDVKKHFSAKYGKEFISNAVELRPDCGVSRLLVEKLSAMAPDGPTKIKVLSKIAEEHNIKWDPTSFEERELNPPEDLLNGPNTFDTASKMHLNSLNSQDPKVQTSLVHDLEHDAHFNYSGPEARTSVGNQNSNPTVAVGLGTSSTNFHPNAGTSGTGSERMEAHQSIHGQGNAHLSGRQNWNMEFKDAASAAKAAAESAERASMAARVAAELSSLGKNSSHHSTESHTSNIHGLRDEQAGRYVASEFPSEHLGEESVNGSFVHRTPKLPKDYGNKHDNLRGSEDHFYRDDYTDTKIFRQSASSRKGSFDDEPWVNNLQNEGSYHQNSLSEERDVKERIGSENEWQDGLTHENFHYGREERIKKQSSLVSTHSHSNVSTDYRNISNVTEQKFGNDAIEHRYRDTPNTSFRDDSAVVFDESGSDDDDFRFDVGPTYDEKQAKMYFPSPDRKSSIHPSEIEENSLELHASTAKSDDAGHPDDFGPVTFDDSDGPDSKSEGEQKPGFSQSNLAGSLFTKLSGTYDSAPPSSHSSSYSKNSFQKPQLESDDLGSETTHHNQGEEANFSKWQQSSRISVATQEEDNVYAQSAPETSKSNELLKQSTVESGSELNFGSLTGGLRNKGYRHSSYSRSSPDGSFSLSKKAADEASTPVEQSTMSLSVKDSSSRGESRKVGDRSSSRVPIAHSDSSSDASSEEIPRQTRSGQQSYTRKGRNEVNLKSSLRAPITYFSSDSDDSDEDLPKQISTSRGQVGSGFSRRTKASRLSSETSTHFDSRGGSEASVTSASGSMERKFNRSSYGAEAASGHLSQAVSSEASVMSSSGMERRSTRSSHGAEAAPKPQSQAISFEVSATSSLGMERKSSRSPYDVETPAKRQSQTVSSSQQGIVKNKPTHTASSKESLKISSTVEPLSPPKTKVGSASIKDTKTSRAEPPERESSAKHVHPKLPDYDTLAAHFQSLRSNRQ